MLKIGLTGGIGCGKTTVANFFQELGAPIIDADVIAHQLVEPNQPALSQLQQCFGNSIINTDKSLNRDKLRAIVFSDKKKKQQLEDILHPLVYQKMQSEVDKQTFAYAILCIPLLMETNKLGFVDRILVVDCPVSVQVKRVKCRDRLATEQIDAIIASQVSREYRRSHSDDIIVNTHSTTQLAEQVKKLHNQYLLLANGHA